MLNLDGFLRYVPFAALHDGKGYLVERYAFSLYSTAVPTQFERGQRSPEATVGFGVTKEHPGFSALPGVATELQEVFAPGQGVLAKELSSAAGAAPAPPARPFSAPPSPSRAAPPHQPLDKSAAILHSPAPWCAQAG